MTRTPHDAPPAIAARGLRLLALGLALGIALAAAYGPRVASYLEFQQQRPGWALEDGVVPANLDAYYWFRSARMIRDGSWQRDAIDPLRNHPAGVSLADPPWIARAIAAIARWTDGDVYGAGVLFSLLSSGLFVLPAFLYGLRVGMPAAGLLAGLVGATSPAVLTRSYVQWVDTDAVNLFAMWWIAWASCWPRPEQRRATSLGGAALAGFSAALFVAWYEKPALMPVLLAAFALRSAAAGFGWRRAALLVALFALFANPLHLTKSGAYLEKFARNAVARVLPQPAAEPPAAHSAASAPTRPPSESALHSEGIGFVVSELEGLSLVEGLAFVLRPVWLAAAGLLCFALWCARRWRLALPLAPMAVLGFYGWVGPSRHLFFLAPLVGFGLGAGLSAATRAWGSRRTGALRSDALACGLAFALFAGIWALRGPFTPASVLPVPLVASMQNAAKAMPPGSSVWCSFGEGFAVQDLMGAATFTDSAPELIRGHLFAKGLSASDPKTLQRVIAHLESTPRLEINRAFRSDYERALGALLAAPGEIHGAPHLWLARRWLGQFGGKHRRGQWHPSTGWPERAQVVRLRCRPGAPGTLECIDLSGGREVVDLRSGAVTDGVPYDRLIRTDRGFITRERRFERRTPSGWVLVVDRSGDTLSAAAVQGAALESNLVQLFLFGRYDPRYFELVYDDFPVARLYRVLSDPSS